jgi:hypothetical protein
LCYIGTVYKLFYTSCFIQVVLYKLFYTSCFIQVVLYKLFYTSCFIQVVFYKLFYTSCFIQVVLYKLFYTSCFLQVKGIPRIGFALCCVFVVEERRLMILKHIIFANYINWHVVACLYKTKIWQIFNFQTSDHSEMSMVYHHGIPDLPTDSKMLYGLSKLDNYWQNPLSSHADMSIVIVLIRARFAYWF